MRAQVTIDPRWAYKKAGVQDEAGKVLVPPHATLVFDMQLVRDLRLTQCPPPCPRHPDPSPH